MAKTKNKNCVKSDKTLYLISSSHCAIFLFLDPWV